MDTCIFVFSGTGTTLAVAERVSSVLGDNTSIELIPSALRKAMNKEIKVEVETVGLIFPNYFGGIPNIVLEFIRKLNLDNATYIFSIVTAASGQGYGLKFLEEELNNKGKKLNYGKYVSPGMTNYIIGWYYNLLYKTGERQIRALQKMDEQVCKFAHDIICKKYEIQSSSYISYKRSLFISHKEIIEDTRPWDKEFSISNKCIGCGICEKVCQAKNIFMNDSKPYYQHNCLRCMACLQYCPKGAIEFKGKNLNKPKYFHPKYPAKELIHRINNE